MYSSNLQSFYFLFIFLFSFYFCCHCIGDFLIILVVMMATFRLLNRLLTVRNLLFFFLFLVIKVGSLHDACRNDLRCHRMKLMTSIEHHHRNSLNHYISLAKDHRTREVDSRKCRHNILLRLSIYDQNTERKKNVETKNPSQHSAK